MHSHLSPPNCLISPNSPFSPPSDSFLCVFFSFGAMEGDISAMQSLVLKRKRSQRQRPWNSSSSSSSEDDIVDGIPMMTTTTTFSSSSKEDEYEEEHQAAKCLMLLAQGKYSFRVSERAEMIITTTKKKINGGLYECKTCYRTFQSFQALGGHRTSHKKMKIRSEELLIQKPLLKQTEESYNNLIAPIALHLTTTTRTPPQVRVHECLICNAVFASGQALGGHMRRHRVTIAINSSVAEGGETSNRIETKSDGVTLSLLSPVPDETGNETSRSNNDFQCLDLNFPVASDEIGESQFCFSSKQPKQQQQQLEDSGLVFSSPALVDCHY